MTLFLQLTFFSRSEHRDGPILTERLVNVDQIADIRPVEYHMNDSDIRSGTRIIWSDSRRAHALVTATLDEIADALSARYVAHDESSLLDPGVEVVDDLVCDHCRRPVRIATGDDTSNPASVGDYIHVSGTWRCGGVATVNGKERP